MESSPWGLDPEGMSIMPADKQEKDYLSFPRQTSAGPGSDITTLRTKNLGV